MQYRGYTIEPEYLGYCYYRTEEGVDCEWDGDSWKSNVRGANSIKEAKELIDEKYFEDQEYIVGGIIFTWLSEALMYAKQSNGVLECRYQFDSI